MLISNLTFQELFDEHAVEPVKSAAGVRTYSKQPYDASWEQIWYVECV